jgi:hypothetical protein
MYANVILEEGLDQFPSLVGPSFWLLMLLLGVADPFSLSSLVITNDYDEYYVQFDVQKIWSMCFRRLLLHAVVEHTTPLCDLHVY